MSWLRIDDHLADHPKIIKIGPLGLAIHIRAMCYASRYLTDGFIPQQAIHGFLGGLEHISVDTGGVIGMFATGQEAIDFDWPELLINAGLWEKAKGGWLIHDYLDYNPSKDKVLADRCQRKTAGQQGAKVTNEKRWGNQQNVNDSPTGRRCLSDDNVVGETSPPSPSPSPSPIPNPQPDPIKDKRATKGYTQEKGEVFLHSIFVRGNNYKFQRLKITQSQFQELKNIHQGIDHEYEAYRSDMYLAEKNKKYGKRKFLNDWFAREILKLQKEAANGTGTYQQDLSKYDNLG